MIAQGWGVAADKTGNTEWQAVTVDAKNSWNMHANLSKKCEYRCDYGRSYGRNYKCEHEHTINTNTNANVDPPRLTTTAH